jgi:RHS repeat-associated protein
LTGITGGGLTASYSYDYLGRRKSKTVGGITTTNLYDGQNLIREVGSTTTDYIFSPGIDEPLAENNESQISYYAADGLGSIAGLNDTAGTTQNSYLYDAWGIVKSQTATVANSFTYTARESAEAGLMFYRARYYSPQIGRFISEDVFALGRPLLHLDDEFDEVETGVLFDLPNAKGMDVPYPQDSLLDTNDNEIGLFHAYTYASNNPLLYRDPTGKQLAPAIPYITEATGMAAAAAAATLAALKICKNVRCRPRIDPDKHRFIIWGERCHWQIDCYVKHRPGSKFLTFRIPVPCFLNPYQREP